MSGETEEAEQSVRAANDVSQLMAQRLVAEGVRRPVFVEGKATVATAPPSTTDALDLGKLARLSTPTAAELLARLRELLPLAEKLDGERGHIMPEEYIPLPGESRGTDVAESISLLILQLKRDVEGARGRGLE